MVGTPLRRISNDCSYSAGERNRLARVLERQLNLDIFDTSIIVDVLKSIGAGEVKKLLEE